MRWTSKKNKQLSIHSRTLLAISITLGLLLAIFAIVLDDYYVNRAKANIRQQLENYVYSLLAAAKEDEQGRMRLPNVLADPKLNRPSSGLVAMVAGEQGKYHWQSASLLGLEKSQLKYLNQLLSAQQEQIPIGQFSFIDGHATWMSVRLNIIWEDSQSRELYYGLVVAKERSEFNDDIATFRQILWQGSIAAIVFLLLIQALMLRWGLKPLRRAAHELNQVECGAKDKLAQDYPIELSNLTQSINSLIRHSNDSLQRYRNSLGDLAHSLKTPLAIMQSAYDSKQNELLREANAEQLPRINELISYQLQRASIMGNTPINRVCEVKPCIEKTLNALAKVYADKQVDSSFEKQMDSKTLWFKGDQGDLMEAIGNLLDNAYKYGDNKIRVKASLFVNESAATGQDSRLLIQIEDNGPGLNSEQKQRLLERGKRADELHHSNTQGHGIGLNIVSEIAKLYQGELLLEDSDLGGLRVKLVLPGLSTKMEPTKAAPATKTIDDKTLEKYQ